MGFNANFLQLHGIAKSREILRLRFAQDDTEKKGIAMIDLKSMAVTMPEVVGHPNRVAFEGVLTTVDIPSQRAPSGAKGHLVVLTRRAAEAALPSLLGMALDYSPALDRHDVRCKVGVITRAEIVGSDLELGGHLFARDFPEIVREVSKSKRDPDQYICASRERPAQVRTLQAEANLCDLENWKDAHRFKSSLWAAAERIRRLAVAMPDPNKNLPGGNCRSIRAETELAAVGKAGLGLSYEVTDVLLADAKAEVWRLEKVTFTGAAILRRDKAAYRKTWIELSR
jgi:hypothetical protein